MALKKRDILTTIALPYANGQLHLGHMVEAVQADIWVRFQKLIGNRCWYICGSDAHGTAVMLSAEKKGVSPEQWVETIRADHARDFKAFQIAFDNFHSTHSDENRELSTQVYRKLQSRGDIESRTITQAFDNEKQLFLSDRYIKGTCPRCNAADQYGDNCEQCGATYSPLELKQAVSVLSGTAPSQKESEHYFFKLEHYRALLDDWLTEEHLQPSIVNKLKEWFSDTLRDWDISRDAPYFGFEIPDHPGKYFYVWLDAPVGYIASTQHLAQRDSRLDPDRYWQPGSETELVHFVGKDIVYFHALFWPAMLHGAGYRLPSKIHVHGYLTVDGEKMSKSRGTYITAQQYAQHLNVDCLRYYYAAKLNAQVVDLDLNFDDFMARVNSDLVGKFVNLASRCAGFIKKKFAGRLASALDDQALYQELVGAASTIAELYDGLEYNRCMREIMALADRANQYIDQQKPWVLAKQEGEEAKVQAVCTQGLNLFAVLAVYLSPVMPGVFADVEAFLNTSLTWESISQPLLDHDINPFKPLLQRITADDIEKLKDEKVLS